MKTKFKITGPGEYRTRDREKAVVLHTLRQSRETKRALRFKAFYLGYVVSKGEHRPATWYDDGEASEHPDSDSLVSRVRLGW